MKLYKTLVIAALTVFLVSGAAAATTKMQINNTDIKPGENQTVGKLQVQTSVNETVTVSALSTFQLPFNVQYTASLPFSTGPNTTKSVPAKVSVPSGTSPGTYQAQTVTSFENQSNQENSWNIDVPSVKNFTVKDADFRQNVSIGSSDQLGNILLSNTGNSQINLDISVDGNISEYLFFNPQVVSQPGIEKELVFDYQIPRDTPFGYYTGNITLNYTDGSKTVGAATSFVDGIKPEYSRVDVESLMATTEKRFEVEVRDNLEVETLVMQVSKQESIEKGNSSVTVNNSFETYSFGRSSPNSDLWVLNFTDTADISQYYYNLTATDESGNTKTVEGGFEVEGLDATHILADNFDFDPVKPGKTASKAVVRNDISTNVSFVLESFAHNKKNSSISIGIRHENEDVAQNFDLNQIENNKTATLEFDREGDYFLEVSSELEKDDFRGRIDVVPVPQHYDVGGIVFEGQVVDPEYPECNSNYTLGGFEGEICFKDRDAAVKRTITFKAENSNAEQCKGFEQWGKCVPGFSLGSLQNARETRDAALTSRDRYYYGLLAAVIYSLGVTGFYIRRVYLEGKLKAYMRPKKTEVNL